MDWIITFYNFNEELINQKNFKQDYDKAMKYNIENKKQLREKGIFIALFHGKVNPDYPYEDA